MDFVKFGIIMSLSTISSAALAGENCTGAGPQAPRDLTEDATKGTNGSAFSLASNVSKMNLCNIHFHKSAEHRAPGFEELSAQGEQDGYVCKKTSATQNVEPSKVAYKDGCKGLAAGDTIEVHWVYTSCDVTPGPGLGSCLSANCANPQLRVESSTFRVVNNQNALDFREFDLGQKTNGYFQPKKLPEKAAATAYLGSTTGPKYSDEKCSPLQVGWNVGHGCQDVDLNTVHAWCDKNAFDEKEDHGVRVIVKKPELLSPLE